MIMNDLKKEFLKSVVPIGYEKLRLSWVEKEWQHDPEYRNNQANINFGLFLYQFIW